MEETIVWNKNNTDAVKKFLGKTEFTLRGNILYVFDEYTGLKEVKMGDTILKKNGSIYIIKGE